jgi:hypothetical protein
MFFFNQKKEILIKNILFISIKKPNCEKSDLKIKFKIFFDNRMDFDKIISSLAYTIYRCWKKKFVK